MKDQTDERNIKKKKIETRNKQTKQAEKNTHTHTHAQTHKPTNYSLYLRRHFGRNNFTATGVCGSGVLFT